MKYVNLMLFGKDRDILEYAKLSNKRGNYIDSRKVSKVCNLEGEEE